jgi:hypothetical protein
MASANQWRNVAKAGVFGDIEAGNGWRIGWRQLKKTGNLKAVINLGEEEEKG